MLPWSFLQRHWRALTFGFVMCLLSSFGQTFFFSLFGSQIKGEFGISDGEFGTIYSIGTLASAAAIIWSGRLVDRLHLRDMAAIVLAGLAFMCAMMWLTASAAVLVFIIFGLRQFGQGLASHTGITSTARRFTRERGRAVSVASLGHTVGEAILPVIVVAALLVFDWHRLWLFSALFLLATIPAVRWLIGIGSGMPADTEQTASAKPVATGIDHRVGEVVRDASFWLRLPCLITTSMIGTGLIFHQIAIVDAKGWSLGTWAGSYSIMAVTTVVAVIVAGPVIDRLTGRRILPLYLVPMTLACFVMWGGESQWTAPVFMAFLGLSAGFGQIMQGVIWAELYGVAHLGSIRALGQAVMVFGSGVAPAVMGLALDAGYSIETISLASALYCIAAALLALAAPAPRRERTG